MKKRFSFNLFLSQILAIALSVICLLGGLPAMADNPPTAAIVLDGRSIFSVSKSGDYTAQQRAEEANRILQKTVNTATPSLEVEIDQSRGLPVLEVKGNYLLSVNPEDTPQGRTPLEQAQSWKEQLEQAIQRAQYERTQAYLSKAAVKSLIAIIIACFLTWRVGWLWRRWLQPWLEKKIISSEILTLQTSLEPTLDSTLQPHTQSATQLSSPIGIGSQIVPALLRGLIWLATLLYIFNLFPRTRQWSHNLFDILVASLVSDLFSLGNRSYSVLDLFILAGLFVCLFVLARMVRTALLSRVVRITGLSRAAQYTIALITNYIILFIGTIVLLQIWGLDISSLTVFAGILGVGIGLGIQGIAKEFVSGLVLIFERPIQVGDFVEVGDLMGTVERISVRSTEIRTLDQVSVILPNSRFLESEVINWSHGSPISRLKIPVGVAYGSNLTTVEKILIEVAKGHRNVLPKPSPRVFFTGFGDSALNFDLLVWIAKPYKQFQIKSDLNFRIDESFRSQGIEIPFPQQDLHIRSGNSSLTVSPELVESLSQLSNSLAAWLKAQSDRHES